MDKAHAKALEKIIKYEDKNHGGFTKIYPLEKNEEYYKNFIAQSDSTWQSWTGAKPRTAKNDSTPKIKLGSKDDAKIEVKINKIFAKPPAS